MTEEREPTAAEIRQQFTDGLKLIAQMRGQIDLLRAQLTDRWDNHHNALACPYCNPDRELLTVDQIAALTQDLSEARAALAAREQTIAALNEELSEVAKQIEFDTEATDEERRGLSAKVEALEGVLRQVWRYASHATGCMMHVSMHDGFGRQVTRYCTCGLDAILSALPDPVKEQKP